MAVKIAARVCGWYGTVSQMSGDRFPIRPDQRRINPINTGAGHQANDCHLFSHRLIMLPRRIKIFCIHNGLRLSSGMLMQIQQQNRSREAVGSINWMMQAMAIMVKISNWQPRRFNLIDPSPKRQLLFMKTSGASRKQAFYAGAGTSIRIGVQDGVELSPTFDWPEDRTGFIIAGGEAALTRSVEMPKMMPAATALNKSPK